MILAQLFYTPGYHSKIKSRTQHREPYEQIDFIAGRNIELC